MRDALLGSPALMDGDLWVVNIRLARVLAATIPSGNSVVVRLRLALTTLINAPCTFPVLPVSWVTPIIDISSISRPWPVSYIYVGHGPHGSELNPSPWGSPFSNPSTGDCGSGTSFSAYANDRADIQSWLRPLV